MTKPTRAWTGKLSRLDNLMSWMYDNDIMNTTDKTQKDRIFRAYYRYYNDGDKPKGYSFVQDHLIEEFLEQRVEEFIIKMITKYRGKYDRKQFWTDRKVRQYNTIKEVATNNQIESVNYFIKDSGIKDQMINDHVDSMNGIYDSLKQYTDAACERHDWEESYNNPKGLIIEAKRRNMKKAGIWTVGMESKFRDLAGECHKIVIDMEDRIAELNEK